MRPPRRPRRYILIDQPRQAQSVATSGAAPEIPSDLLSFAKLCGFEPDPLQSEILTSNAHRGILVGGRQIGKSTLLALMAAHNAVTEPKCLVLLLGPYGRQAGEILEKAKDFLTQLGYRTPGDGRNRHSLRLPNRSRIVAVPAVKDRVRCFSAVRLLIIDEAALVPDSTYKVVRPMLAASGGDLWLISTPMGRRGFFFNAWANGGEKWTRFSYPATQCPRISADYLDEERSELTENEFRREFLCEFIDPNATMFRLEVLLRAINPNITRLPQ